MQGYSPANAITTMPVLSMPIHSDDLDRHLCINKFGLSLSLEYRAKPVRLLYPNVFKNFQEFSNINTPSAHSQHTLATHFRLFFAASVGATRVVARRGSAGMLVIRYVSCSVPVAYVPEVSHRIEHAALEASRWLINCKPRLQSNDPKTLGTL